MSGIVGIVNLDGRPVDRALLERMTASLDFRGPDARQVWVDGAVGFGHTLLRTTFEAEYETQPLSFDGKTWIVADCRVDAREELVGKLHAKGRRAAALDRPDVELILHAWHVWGEACVEHLLGDFAFAIWDAPNRRLFCARDHMGVKLFYYARRGATVVFGNTLDAVRMHPDVGDRLNDLAIADFLMFDMNQDPETTSFADVMRLPSAHAMRSDAQGQAVSRYWSLPIDEPIYFKRASDYTERFVELLDRAVADRLRTDKVGVFMSGGLDSTTLAATACKLQRARSSTAEVHAFTTVVDSLDGGERAFATQTARFLGIPIRIVDHSETYYDRHWHRAAERTPEPYLDPTRLTIEREEAQISASHARVWFYGQGPDNALTYEWRPYLSHLWRNGDVGRLAASVGAHLVEHRRIPLLPTLPRMLRERMRPAAPPVAAPPWLRDIRTGCSEEPGPPDGPRLDHPLRPRGHASLQLTNWSLLFQTLDPEFTLAPQEVRHPYLSLPLMRYMLSVPAMPWCRRKLLIRKAMRGALPAPVLRRSKFPLQGIPRWLGAQLWGLPELVPAKELCQYLDPSLVPDNLGSDQWQFVRDFRARALNYWMMNSRDACVSSVGKEL